MGQNMFIILVLIFTTCNASGYPQHQPTNNHVTRTSGATWLQKPQIGRSIVQSDVQDDVVDMKEYLDKLKILDWIYSELKNHLSLRFVAAKSDSQQVGSKFSSSIKEYSSSKLSPENNLKTQKLAKRLMGHYHRQFLSKAVDSIKNEKFNKPARFNFDLGKRSRPRSSDTEDQIDQMEKMIRKYRENDPGGNKGFGLNQLYMDYLDQYFHNLAEEVNGMKTK